MWWAVLGGWAALWACAADHVPTFSTVASPVALTAGAPSDASARPAAKLVENIRRQLMHDNYDYVYVESSAEKTIRKLSSATAGSVSRRSSAKATAASLTTTYAVQRATNKRVTFKEDEENSSIPISIMNEDTLKFKAYEEPDKLQGVSAVRKQMRNKSSESKIHPLLNDLLYYIDDKHLRRNNYVSEDTSKGDTEDTLLDSGENNFYTTMSLTSPKKIDDRLYKGYRQRSRMYGVHRKRPNIRVDYKKRNRHRRKRPQFRHKGKKYRQRNMPLRKANIDGKVNSQSDNGYIEEDMKEQVKDTVYNDYNDSTTKAAHTAQNDDQLDQKLNEKNASYYEYQNDNQNETVYRDIAKEETRLSERRQDKYNAILHDQSDTNSDEQFYSQDNSRDRRRSNGGVTNDMAEQVNAATVAGVKYRLLKMRSGRSARRSGPGPLHVVQERGPSGVVLWGLEGRPLPQFRLPAPRRQYMHQRAPRRPALEEQLPKRTYHGRH